MPHLSCCQLSHRPHIRHIYNKHTVATASRGQGSKEVIDVFAAVVIQTL